MEKSGKIKYNLLKKVIPGPFKEMAIEMIDSCQDVGKHFNKKFFYTLSSSPL